MSNRSKPIITLLALAAFCGSLVSMSNLLSREKILENQTRFAQKKMIEIANDPEVELHAIQPDVYRLESQGKTTGFVFKQSTEKGYNGNITFWLGVDTEGEILGVRIISHKETPGLGDKIETNVSDWIHAFAGASLENRQASDWAVKKQGGTFDQFSGATITPAAVIDGVKTGLVHFENHASSWSEAKDKPVYRTEASFRRGEDDEY